jgi:hypothetical protein
MINLRALSYSIFPAKRIRAVAGVTGAVMSAVFISCS